MTDEEWIDLYFDGDSFYKDSLTNMALVDELPTTVLKYLVEQMAYRLAPLDPRVVLALCDKIKE